jgi:PAP2 superfamily
MKGTHRKNERAMVSHGRWRLLGLVAAALLTAGTGHPISGEQLDPGGRSRGGADARVGVEGHRADGRVIAEWNRVAHDIAFAADQFLTFKGQRALSMMHLAMHDAVNSIVPLYERYAYAGEVVRGDPVAAAAQAAHDVLISEYPGQGEALGQELTRWLGEVGGGVLQENGIGVGHAAAGAILAIRGGDGWDLQGTYTFRDGAGEYQTTPPWNGFVAQPGFRFATPFALESPAQFRPPPPPPLAGSAYAKAFQEVQELGVLDSPRRTMDQTALAIWWMEFAEGSVNRLARQLVLERRLDAWAAARLFAHVGAALFDTYLAIWDSKYEYNHWRPYTAIRRADADGNRRTSADPAWEPLRPTPPFPEYASAHAAACAASFAVLERTLGSRPFTMGTTSAPPGMPERTFPSFRAAARECAESRVLLGWHFRYATDAGARMGLDIAAHVLDRTLRPNRRAGNRW